VSRSFLFGTPLFKAQNDYIVHAKNLGGHGPLLDTPMVVDNRNLSETQNILATTIFLEALTSIVIGEHTLKWFPSSLMFQQKPAGNEQ